MPPSRRKSESRNPKYETNPNHRNPKSETSSLEVLLIRISDLAFVSDFEIRISDFPRRGLSSPLRRQIHLGLAQVRGRLLGRDGVDVKPGAPLEAGHAGQPRNDL